MAVCDVCGAPATRSIARSGRDLCDAHYESYVERKVARTISRYGMLRPRERIGVAVSGGKDSMSLLRILSRMAPRHGSELVAIVVHEGIGGRVEESHALAERYARDLGLRVASASFEELFGHALPELVAMAGGRSSACAICGPLRRRAIDVLAAEEGVDVVATGHHMDDFLQTFLIAMMEGDLKRVAWMHPGPKPDPEGRPRRIQPLVELYEEEVLEYARTAGIPFYGCDCPFRRQGIRVRIRAFLRELEARSPGAKEMMFRSALALSRAASASVGRPEYVRCRHCGWPSTSEVCNACSTLISITGEPINIG
ncbi:MAG: ATP-binding protein, partial [Conexivisphaera sp.]